MKSPGPRLSIILPTTHRPTLRRAITSAMSQMAADDELLIVGEKVADLVCYPFRVSRIYCTPGRDWGNLERNIAMQYARGTHLVFLDDDDQFLVGGLEAVRNALVVNPDRPHMFRMIDQNGLILWQTKEVKLGNHGSPCFVTPNDFKRLSTWPRGIREADFVFCKETLKKYPPGALIWSEVVIYGSRGWIMGPMRTARE